MKMRIKVFQGKEEKHLILNKISTLMRMKIQKKMKVSKKMRMIWKMMMIIITSTNNLLITKVCYSNSSSSNNTKGRQRVGHLAKLRRKNWLRTNPTT
jgi:hypothetical protein